MTTVVVQTIIAIDTATMAIYICGFWFCTVSHILGFLDIIQEAIEIIMKQQMLANLINYDNEAKSKLDLDVLAIINRGVKDKTMTFDEWTQIFTNMIFDLNSVISCFKKLHTGFFLVQEVASLGSLFICGLIFTVVNQQYFSQLELP